MDVDDSSSLSSLSDHEDAGASSPAPDNNASTPADTATNGAPASTDHFRRRSTRVVKKPEPYVEPPSTRKPKRKRPATDEGSDSAQEEEGEEAAAGDDASSSTVQGDDEEDEGDVDDEDEDDEEVATEDEEDESEGEPDEEELKELRRKSKRAGAGKAKAPAKKARVQKSPKPKAPKKPAAKRAKTTAAAETEGDDEVDSPDEDAPLPQKKKARARPKPRQTNGDGTPLMVNNIYDAVFVAHQDPDDVASNWIAKYEGNNAEGMKEMVNFILKCCGCNNEVTNYDIEDQDSAAATLSQIQEAFQKQETADYPLTSKKPAFRKFRQYLNSFVESLVSALSTKGYLVAESPLVENMNIWIATMSSSTLRQFRHTSTVVALDMVSHLAEVAAEIRRANGTTNRQLEAENKKAQLNEARIQALQEKLAKGEEKRDAVENIIKDLFDTVFVHRYRDIDPKIRAECMHELGGWILTLPDVFFDGTYLRYLGWVLSDTTPTTRLEVVKALTKLFRRKDSVAGLRHFTERFRPRLVEMGTRDADSNVRTATVELLDVVREVGYLEPADISTVGRLLFDSEQKVRRAVVPFFVENMNDEYNDKIDALGGQAAVKEALGSEQEDYEGPTNSWIKLKCLVEALASYDQEEADEEDGHTQSLLAEKNSSIVTKVGEIVSRYSLAGAVLWDSLDEVRDWEGIARYLLFDHSASRTDGEADPEDVEKAVKSMVALDPKEEIILLQVLNASVTGSIIKGPEPAHTRKPGQNRTQKEVEKHKENVSRGLMKLIPPLLRKFGPVPDACASVLRLVQLMNLEVFQQLRQVEAYGSLLDDVLHQFLTHADASVLKEASGALMHAKTFESLEETTDSKISGLKDTLNTSLATAVRGKALSTAKFSDAALTELINTVRRLEYLAGINDVVEMLENPAPAASAKGKQDKPSIDILLDILSRGTSTDELDEELMTHALKTVTFYFMWKVRAVNKSPERDITDELIDGIVARRTTAVDHITTLLSSRNNVDVLETAAAATLLDLTTLFVSATNAQLNSLTSTLTSTHEELLGHVLDGIEKSYAKSIGVKLEPAENAAPEDDDDEEDESQETDETTKLALEQQLCEYAAKIVVAALARVLEPKSWRKRLQRNYTRLGANYKEVVNHIDRAVIRAGGRKPAAVATPAAPKEAPVAVRAQPSRGGKKSALSEEHVMDTDEEEEEEEQEEEAPEEEEQQEEEEEEDEGDKAEEDRESEPDPEVEVPNVDEDGDEEMADA